MTKAPKTAHTIVRAFLKTTSIKGIPRAFNSASNVTRFFWGLTTIGCICMLLYQVISLLLKYYANLVTINSFSSAVPPNFPDVTICNQSPFDAFASFNEPYEDYLAKVSLLRQLVADSSNIKFDNDPDMWSLIQSKSSYVGGQPPFLGTLPLSANSSFVPDCTWFEWNWSPVNNETNPEDNPCKNNINVRWDPIFYRCYTFRPPADTLMGFSAILYVDNWPTSTYNSTTMNLDISMASGMRMYIHERDTYPLVLLGGINVSPGSEVTIRLSQTNVTHLPAPYGSCTFQPLLDMLDNKSFVYSQAACQSVCRQQQYIDHCGCLATQEAYTTRQLASVNNTFCINPFYSNTSASYDILSVLEMPKCWWFYYAQNQLCNCPMPCSEQDYSTTISISDWPNTANRLAIYEKYIEPHPEIYGHNFDVYKGIIAQVGTDNTTDILRQIDALGLIKNNFLQLNIIHDVQSVLINNDIPGVTWDTLFSNLGGSLNLWMGITILFAAEVIELMFRVLSIYCYKITEEEGQEDTPDPELPVCYDSISTVSKQRDEADGTSIKSEARRRRHAPEEGCSEGGGGHANPAAVDDDNLSVTSRGSAVAAHDAISLKSGASKRDAAVDDVISMKSFGSGR